MVGIDPFLTKRLMPVSAVRLMPHTQLGNHIRSDHWLWGMTWAV